MLVDAVHVNVNQERQGSGSGSWSSTGKGGKGGKGKSKKGGKGNEKDDKSASEVEGECRYCEKKGHNKVECRKMKADLAAGKCDKHGKPNVHSLTATRASQPSPQASCAPSMLSTILMQQMVPVLLPNRTASQHSETWLINMIVPAQKTLMVASLDGAEYALLDSGPGLTSCPINYADTLPLLPRRANRPILSNVTGGGVECIWSETSRSQA